MIIPTSSICSVCSTLKSPPMKSDWRLHKVFCKNVASLGPRPKDHKLSFFFPVESKEPKLEWVYCEKVPHYLDDEEVLESPNLKPLLEALGSKVEIASIAPDRRKSGENYSIVFYCNKDCSDNEAKFNKSVLFMTKGTPGRWNGPLVLLRREDSGWSTTYSDVVLADFRLVIEHMKFQVPYEQKETQAPRWNAMLLRCLGDPSPSEGKALAALCEDVRVVHEMREPTNVSKQMGLPLLIERLARPASLIDTFDEDPLENPCCNFLNLDIRPDSETWGKTPPYWKKGVGNVLVARQDKRDLSYYQLIAIAAFLEFMAVLMKVPMDRSGRETFVRIMFTKETFETFFFDMFIHKMKAGNNDIDGFCNMTSPYSNCDRLAC
ncbi:hypothetical protein NHQ30_009256 [Ciborinia camelliae]|nr:hypothetical protein NHQ30_009256 [Ciborinia camelliae]